jgi:hypothetical protein
MRIMAELADLIGLATHVAPWMFVTDTLGSPNDVEGWMFSLYGPIAALWYPSGEVHRQSRVTLGDDPGAIPSAP